MVNGHCYLCSRRQIKVSKVLVHDNFTVSSNDIALLRLGKTDFYNLQSAYCTTLFSEEQVDLSVFSPACLPSNSSSLVGQEGHVYGEQRKPLINFYPVSISGWGDTGVQETSTDKLQETVVPIVQSSNCTEKMDQAEGVTEDQIICAGGAGAGPCKVSHQRQCHQFGIMFIPGRQWRTTYNSEHGGSPHSGWDRQQKAWRDLQRARPCRLHQRLCSPTLD